MTSEAKLELKPKLRFPDFQGKWEPTTLGAITFKTDKKNKEDKKYPIYSINNTAGFVPQAEQFEGVDSNKRGYDTTLYKVIEKNTFAYNPARINVGSIGYSGELNNILISSLYVCFKSNKNVDDKFLSHFFTSSIFEKSVHSKAEGGIRSYLFYENFSRIKILLPDKKEQQIIAECLGTLDELTGAESQKLDALKAHKTGLMQQLFPCAGETRPRLRFPEFQTAPEWDRRHFSELCDIKHGYAFEGEFFSNEGDYVLLTPGNFYEEGGYRDRGENQKYYTGEIPGDYLLNRGDLLVAMTEQAAGLLGSPILVPESDKFLHNQRLGLVTKKPGVTWTNEFFFYVFNSQAVRNAIHASASGMKVRHTSPPKIGEVVISVPRTLPEQQRIADCLSALDELIAAQSTKVAALHTHKQGLMQQLFPTPEEIKS